jgi:hypothetical protein
VEEASSGSAAAMAGWGWVALAEPGWVEAAVVGWVEAAAEGAEFSDWVAAE